VGQLEAEGGRVGASFSLSPRLPLRLGIDGGAVYGRRSDPLGTIDVVLISGALALTGFVSVAHGTLEFGPEVESGGLWAHGNASRPGVIASGGTTLVIATSFAATLRGRLGDRSWLGVAVRGGVVLRGATLLADAREAGGFTGAMLGARAGVSFDP
jgi:hypothetical protein